MNFPKVTKKECSDTGMAMTLICLIVGFITNDLRWFYGATCALLLTMVWAKSFYFVAKIWLGFSQVLGAIMSRIILTIIFFALLTPLALLRRAFGHDPMKRKDWKRGNKTAFETRNHTYSSREIEQPF